MYKISMWRTIVRRWVLTCTLQSEVCDTPSMHGSLQLTMGGMLSSSRLNQLKELWNYFSAPVFIFPFYSSSPGSSPFFNPASSSFETASFLSSSNTATSVPSLTMTLFQTPPLSPLLAMTVWMLHARVTFQSHDGYKDSLQPWQRNHLPSHRCGPLAQPHHHTVHRELWRDHKELWG